MLVTALVSLSLLAAPAAGTAPADDPAPAGARAAGRPSRRPVTTYSIVARDPETGQLGVAVQSHWFSVGQLVPWAEAGVGVVATQSFVEPAHGPRGLDLMRRGLAADEALRALLSVDAGREVRQVAFLDAAGRVAAHTGARCIEAAGHQTGEGYSVQANMMDNEAVVPAMAAAFERAQGPLPDRLLAALEAAEAAGGDVRGRQSAALLVVAGEGTGRPWADRLVDLRVEDHPAPVEELGRLLTLQRAYDEMNAGDVAVERGELAEALAHYEAAARLAPDNLEVRYWQALTLATAGREAEAMPIFRDVFAKSPGWVELTRRLRKPGIVPDTPEGRALVERIVSQAPRDRSTP